MAGFSPGGSSGQAELPAAPPAWLDVKAAFRDGWGAFRRAPWVFTGFTLLFISLGTVLTLINKNLNETGLTPLTGLIAQLCQLGSSLVGLWGALGTMRGAMLALAGQRPRFSDLTRVDGRAILRVILANLLLYVLMLVVLLPLLIAMGSGLTQLVDVDFSITGEPIVRSFNPTPALFALTFLPLLGALGLITYVTVNQHFLLQLAALGRRGPWRTLVEGRAVIDRQWGAVMRLLLLESLLVLAGLLALVLGLFVAMPLIICISTAAYLQLFPDPEGPAGLPAA
jgi:hypothetical protein